MSNIGWKFDTTYLALPEILFSRVAPTPVKAARMVLFNEALSTEMGLSEADLRSTDGVDILGGNRVPDGAQAIAQAYAGHQFGGFSILGDGRAVLLGEHITPAGDRVDIQLKGSGPTPYSRRGDGRAALGPMLREYVISQAMHAMGIPTTRSLAVVATGEPVFRQTVLPGAILTRVASSHLRVGTYQFAATRGDPSLLQTLVTYAIDRHYPDLSGSTVPALALLERVVDVQASLLCHWMRVGFIHGVMNTDNMTIGGQTIDYGPCAFMDSYDPLCVFSSIDEGGRYAFANQPGMAQWNLLRFAEALLPLLNDDQEQAIECAKQAIGRFASHYTTQYKTMMLAKLGLPFSENPQNDALVQELLQWMHSHAQDYTYTFSALTYPTQLPVMMRDEVFEQWHTRWQASKLSSGLAAAESEQLMRSHNPTYIPRNALVEEALDAAQTDELDALEQLLTVLSEPYAAPDPARSAYFLPPSKDTGYVTFCGT